MKYAVMLSRVQKIPPRAIFSLTTGMLIHQRLSAFKLQWSEVAKWTGVYLREQKRCYAIFGWTRMMWHGDETAELVLPWGAIP